MPGPVQDGVRGFCSETEGRQPLDGEAALCQALHKMGDQGSKRPVQCHIIGGETKGQGRRGPAKVTHEGKAELGLGTGLSVPCQNGVHSRPPPLCHKCQEALSPSRQSFGVLFLQPHIGFGVAAVSSGPVAPEARLGALSMQEVFL